MSRIEEDSESDAPEEFTAEQGLQQDVQIQTAQKESKARSKSSSSVLVWEKGIPKRVVVTDKERRKKWAERRTPKRSRLNADTQDGEIETHQEESKPSKEGMLPDEIVNLLAAQEKHVFLSDSEEEIEEKRLKSSRKKKLKTSGSDPIILKDLPPSRCLNDSLEFLKKRKMQVPRSSTVLNNSNQALRLLSTSLLLSKQR
ncbi:uncharacterized protein LOC124926605 [Impatiens glandulifera]|uniref:uncharacterized protein LOC124926605 n=1 Tax=Impatiens glandulifera TaxID=253017 RepID=UPI001FB07537|nr:uncharacterized protein LOC124926605 [Impatiens glandulifera]